MTIAVAVERRLDKHQKLLLTGLSTDADPTDADVSPDSLKPQDLLFLTDTKVTKEYDGSNWNQISTNGAALTSQWPSHNLTLASGMSADGNGSAVTYSGGNGSYWVDGDFGSGGVMKLQFSYDSGTTWIDVPGVSLAAEGVVNFSLGPCQLRVNLNGATSPDLDAGIL